MTLASRPASPGTNVPSRNQSAPLELFSDQSNGLGRLAHSRLPSRLRWRTPDTSRLARSARRHRPDPLSLSAAVRHARSLALRAVRAARAYRSLTRRTASARSGESSTSKSQSSAPSQKAMSCGRARADLHPAAVLPQRLDAALRPRAHPLLDDRGRRVHDDPAGHLHLHLAGLAGDVRRDVLGRELPGPEPVPDRAGLAHPVAAEGAPVVALEVEGDEVPALAPVDELVGLDPALGGGPGVVGVGEPDHLAVAGGRGDQGQQLARDVARRDAGRPPGRCGPGGRRPVR